MKLTKQNTIKTILEMIKEKETEKKKKKTKKQLHIEIEILWKYIDCKDVDDVCNELEKNGL